METVPTADTITAVATAAAALFTAVAARAAWKGAEVAGQSAQSAQDALRAGQRPILLDVPPKVTPTPENRYKQADENAPKIDLVGRYSVPVRNVGPGIALIQRFSLSSGEDEAWTDTTLTIASNESAWLEGLHSPTSALSLAFANAAQGSPAKRAQELGTLRLWVQYSDLSGNQRNTLCLFIDCDDWSTERFYVDQRFVIDGWDNRRPSHRGG